MDYSVIDKMIATIQTLVTGTGSAQAITGVGLDQILVG